MAIYLLRGLIRERDGKGAIRRILDYVYYERLKSVLSIAIALIQIVLIVLLLTRLAGEEHNTIKHLYAIL